ncbi:hypothetical protein GCM10010869_03100 [Mesorhizobium tianshanense]|nr:hypothetical protein GCM10010869_03100 [Mesorhizobium tianshanense]
MAAPGRLAGFLTLNPATVQEKWFARLYFIRPAILTGMFWLPVVWMQMEMRKLSSQAAAAGAP